MTATVSTVKFFDWAELQNDHELDYFQRMSYGAAKALSEHISSGFAYGEVKRIISVNIVYFELGVGQDYIYHGSTVFKGLHRHDQLDLSDEQKSAFSCQEIGQIFPEYYLIKVKRFEEPKDTLDQWIYFFQRSEIRPEFKAKGLKEAKQRLKVIQMTQAERDKYNAFLKARSISASVFDTHFFLGRFHERKELELLSAGKKKAEAGKQKAEARERQQALKVAEMLRSLHLPETQIRETTGLSFADLDDWIAAGRP